MTSLTIRIASLRLNIGGGHAFDYAVSECPCESAWPYRSRASRRSRSRQSQRNEFVRGVSRISFQSATIRVQHGLQEETASGCGPGTRRCGCDVSTRAGRAYQRTRRRCGDQGGRYVASHDPEPVRRGLTPTCSKASSSTWLRNSAGADRDSRVATLKIDRPSASDEVARSDCAKRELPALPELHSR